MRSSVGGFQLWISASVGGLTSIGPQVTASMRRLIAKSLFSQQHEAVYPTGRDEKLVGPSETLLTTCGSQRSAQGSLCRRDHQMC